jgi:hypothetical protein
MRCKLPSVQRFCEMFGTRYVPAFSSACGTWEVLDCAMTEKEGLDVVTLVPPPQSNPDLRVSKT